MALVFKNIVLAFVYFLVGWLGLTLAIPPGYATIFWPASGIALAAVYARGYSLMPGVFFGQFIMNVFLSLSGHEFSEILAVSIHGFFPSLGAMIQAGLGAFLIRKVVGSDSELKSVKDAFWFALLGGVLACLVSCSFGVTNMLAFGIIQPQDFLFSWSTWYTGDVLGVLVFGPIVALWLTPSQISLKRKTIVTLPMMLFFVATITSFFAIRDMDRKQDQNSLEVDASIFHNSLSSLWNKHLENNLSILNFYQASNFVDRKEFEEFTQSLFPRNPSLFAVGWAPVVSSDEREGFVAEVRKEVPDYTIRNLKKGGVEEIDFSKAPPGKRYTPVLYFHSHENVQNVLGFNFLSEPVRAVAIEQAEKSGLSSSTRPIRFLSKDHDLLGTVLFTPVVKNDELLGFVFSALSYEDKLLPLAAEWKNKGFDILLYYVDDSDQKTVLFKTEQNADLETIEQRNQGRYVYKNIINFAGHQYMLEVYRPADYFAQNVNWSIWGALAASLVFTFLVSVFLLSLTGQTAVVEALVKEKTRQLWDQTAFLKLIMDSIPDFVFVKDKDFKIVQANEAFLELYAPEKRNKVIGTTTLEEFSEEEIESILKQDRMAFAEGFAEGEEIVSDYQGNVRNFHTRKIRFEDLSGESLMLGIARDVTDVVAIRKKLQMILDTTADGLITIRENGIIESYNKACEDMFGYSAEEAIGKNVSIIMTEEYAAAHGSHVHHYLMTGEERLVGRRKEFVAKRKNGEVFPISLALSEMKIGRRRLFTAIIRDITEQKKAQEEL